MSRGLKAGLLYAETPGIKVMCTGSKYSMVSHLTTSFSDVLSKWCRCQCHSFKTCKSWR